MIAYLTFFLLPRLRYCSTQVLLCLRLQLTVLPCTFVALHGDTMMVHNEFVPVWGFPSDRHASGFCAVYNLY